MRNNLEYKNLEADLSLLQTAIASEFDIQINNIKEIMYAGDVSQTYSAEVEGKKVIIKTVEADRNNYAIEAASLGLLQKYGIPSAKPLGYSKLKEVNRAVFIQTAIEGSPIAEIPNLKEAGNLLRDIGQVMYRFHGIKLSGFGQLEIKSDKLQGRSESWLKSLQESENVYSLNEQDSEYLLNHEFIDSTQAKIIENTYQELLVLRLPVASWIHKDISPEHIFAAKNKITGLIDVGAAVAGDPRLDLAVARYFFPKADWVEIAKGYGPSADDPIVDKYLLLVAARKVTYRDQRKFTRRMSRATEILQELLKSATKQK